MKGDPAPEATAAPLPPSQEMLADLSVGELTNDSPPRGWWARLRAALVDPGSVAQRLAALDAAIRARPNAPANYLLRAELYARLGEDALALADFEQARALAESALATDRWGLVNQALRDRAAVGAAAAARRLARAGGQLAARGSTDEEHA